MYTALDVSRYVITQCSQAEKPISNLKLQKVLYFLWADFYRETKKYLFFDDICAWQLGPVVPDVYYQYCSYGGRPIYSFYSSALEPQDTLLLNSLISNYMDIPASALVNRTHAIGSAWDLTYQNGVGNRKVIPFPLIISKEVGS